MWAYIQVLMQYPAVLAFFLIQAIMRAIAENKDIVLRELRLVNQVSCKQLPMMLYIHVYIYHCKKYEGCFNPAWLPQLQFRSHLICM